MEDAKFQALLEEIKHFQAKLFHDRRVAIDCFILEHPELLQVHDLLWYYNNL